MPGEVEDYSHPIIVRTPAMLRAHYSITLSQCAFCAKYLPALVDAYKADPFPDGPYHCMLLAMLQNNYFAKYMRSPLGSELYNFFVTQVVDGVSISAPRYLRSLGSNLTCASAEASRHVRHWPTHLCHLCVCLPLFH
jgi:hypothetical protein